MSWVATSKHHMEDHFINDDIRDGRIRCFPCVYKRSDFN